ncbi:MAG: PilZ domain-containing protein [Candidatus Omnitrophica bacterium]|nr:PilZ domain-containing protein [Candidatus Omnitrophota bacterium]
MSSDSRKFVRFEIPLDVALKEPGLENGKREALTKDFSRKGLCLTSNSFNFDLNSVVELELMVPDKKDPLKISGEVVWKKQVDDKWAVGLEFKEIDSACKIDILEFAYNSWLAKIRRHEA